MYHMGPKRGCGGNVRHVEQSINQELITVLVLLAVIVLAVLTVNPLKRVFQEVSPC